MAKRPTEKIRISVAEHRARQRAAGQVSVTVFLSAETVEELDRMKKERGVSSRAPLIEEAVRFYIKNIRA